MLSKHHTNENDYKKIELIKHILIRPEFYIGSVELLEQITWVWNNFTKNFIKKTITIAPGLYKIINELLGN
jgi:DNA topoisomerase-2